MQEGSADAGAAEPRPGAEPPGAGPSAAGHPGASRRIRAAAGATARGARRSARATGHAASYTLRQARRASHAEGAGDSGLSRIIELHAFNAAGDTAVAVSLAGTLFFSGATSEARGQVALFLGVTMLPFAVVAPLVGPFLDRFSHGRRWAIGTTMALRAFLCWVLADAVASGSVTLFPAALGVLVSSKAYGVTRAAAVPRVVPPHLSLVEANSRISLAGVTGAAVSAPLALLASLAGSDWTLRYAFVVFVAGTVLAVLLPAAVDDTGGEERLPMRGSFTARLPPLVVRGLRCNAGLRLLSGFLTLFMAFLLRDEPFPGWENRPELLVALVVGSAGLGSTLGTALGSLLRTVQPALAVVGVLLVATAVVLVTALFYGLATAVLLGLTAGLCQQLGKLSLDALIQAEVPERRRSSTFARSETLLQLSWVVGGFIGIALPLVPRLGLGVAAVLLLACCAWVLSGIREPPAGG